jgi:hypothetical protein
MTRALGLLGLLLLGASQAPAQRPVSRWSWSSREVALAAVLGAALLTDVQQTHRGIDRGLLELNPLIGPHPSHGQLDTYALSAAVVLFGGSAVLPRGRWRTAALIAGIACETFSVIQQRGTIHAGPRVTSAGGEPMTTQLPHAIKIRFPESVYKTGRWVATKRRQSFAGLVNRALTFYLKSVESYDRPHNTRERATDPARDRTRWEEYGRQVKPQ